MSMFEKASRLKLRFETSLGANAVSVENLWELPLTSQAGKVNLNDIAKDLYRQIKEAGEVASFVDDTKQVDEKLALKFDLVKHVIEVKRAEAALKAQEKARAEEKQFLTGLLVQKKNEQLAQMSPEEIEARLAKL